MVAQCFQSKKCFRPSCSAIAKVNLSSLSIRSSQGRNEEYVEGNSPQRSTFVPQDVPAIADVIGRKNFVDRLNWGFSQ